MYIRGTSNFILKSIRKSGKMIVIERKSFLAKYRSKRRRENSDMMEE